VKEEAEEQSEEIEENLSPIDIENYDEEEEHLRELKQKEQRPKEIWKRYEQNCQ
jgi:aromatic ring-opening dioxygenase catalytic subunit (LigB family)